MTYSSALSISRGRFATPAKTSITRGHQRYAGRNQNVVGFEMRVHKLGPVSNTIILVVLACLLGLLYLTQVTKTNTYGYQINSLREEQTQLQTEHDNLELASARLQSLDRVQHSAPATALVPVSPADAVQQ